MKTVRILLTAALVLLSGFSGWAQTPPSSPITLPPPSAPIQLNDMAPPPPTIDCGAPAIKGQIFGNDRQPLPEDAWPVLVIWKYTDSDPGLPDAPPQVLTYVNSTNWYQDCAQGQINPEGKFWFNADWMDNHLDADTYVIGVYTAYWNGYFTVRRGNIHFNGKEDADLGTIIVGKSDIIVDGPIKTKFSYDLVEVSYTLTNIGKRPQGLVPQVFMYLPGDMADIPVEVDTWAIVLKGGQSRFVKHFLPVRNKLIPGFQLWGEVIATDPRDILAAKVRSGFSFYVSYDK